MKYFCVLIISGFIFAQNIATVEKDIQKLKEEIADLELKNSELSQKKDDVLTQIKSIDYTLKLNKKKIDLMNQTIKMLDSNISKNTKNIQELNSNLNKLTEEFKKRLVTMYKYPKEKGWAAVFNSKSVADLNRYLEYKKIFDKQDKQTFDAINKSKKQLANEKQLLLNNQSQKKIDLANLNQYNIQLIAEKQKQAELLNKINKNVTSYQLAIKEKSKEQVKFKTLLSNLIEKAKNSNRKITLSKTFGKNKGKYNWPVVGKVIKKFGKIKHNKFKIYEQNDGIDIKSNEGNPVVSIHEGYVEDAFYQQGYGNTVIINHGSGYLTIYAHLEDVFVKSGDYVVSNEKIGTVGNTGSLDKTSKLHFEIYGNNKPLNPAKWLR